MKGCTVSDQSIFDTDIKGCQPVSVDQCKSGFKVLSNDINTPKNSLDQCCKCKSGTPCDYCLNSTNCTDKEKLKYVSELSNCYSDLTDDTPSDVDSNDNDVDDIKEERSDFEEDVYETLKDGEEKEELDDGVKDEDEESGVSLMLILLGILLLILIVGGFYVYN
tara:strand:+ start:334 stop:825 length:492 start_codon:yes stop_codon:yes gene_type:complete